MTTGNLVECFDSFAGVYKASVFCTQTFVLDRIGTMAVSPLQQGIKASFGKSD